MVLQPYSGVGGEWGSAGGGASLEPSARLCSHVWSLGRDDRKAGFNRALLLPHILAPAGRLTGLLATQASQRHRPEDGRWELSAQRPRPGKDHSFTPFLSPVLLIEIEAALSQGEET